MKLPGSAIVLSGIEGCGKGTLPYFLGEALGKHYSHIVDSSHITGNFNSHLMDSLLIFADEVTYGGNRQIAGKLKAMVTETHMMSEKKGFEAIPYENRARLMVASNEDWFIPAGAESRRWLVLKVSGEVANNRQYFDNLYSSMAEGGTAAMLYDLQRRDITSNLAVAPVTEALIEQRVQYADSGNPIDRWWELCLERESTGCVDFGSTMDSIADEDTDWHRHIGRTELFEQYTEWAIKMGNAKYMKGNSAFYKRMEKYGVQPIRAKKPPIGSKKKTRPYVFIVPPIEQCIEIFDTLRGVTKEDE
jgi:phage/plasmid-associated DNA primase